MKYDFHSLQLLHKRSPMWIFHKSSVQAWLCIFRFYQNYILISWQTLCSFTLLFPFFSYLEVWVLHNYIEEFDGKKFSQYNDGSSAGLLNSKFPLNVTTCTWSRNIIEVLGMGAWILKFRFPNSSKLYK